jgi:glycosyltransferase involved in cell wall biosynthesis
MVNENKFPVSVVIPIFNGASTIVQTLESLLEQRAFFDELIIINDASKDNSKELVEDYLTGKIEYKLIDHKINQGLSNTYNEGIQVARGPLVVTMHQDVILLEDALKKIVEPFGNKKVVAASHISVFSLELWKKFNFWQKTFFSRFYKKESAGLNGQFDCFRKEALEKIGLFEDKPGEDGEIVYKLEKIGLIALTEAKIIHMQNLRPDFCPRDILYKVKLHSEARGGLLRRGRIKGLGLLIKTFFRELMILSLLIPYINIFGITLIFIYSILYTKQVYLEEYANPRILILPFWNIFLLFAGFYYSLRGFVYGRSVYTKQ